MYRKYISMQSIFLSFLNCRCTFDRIFVSMIDEPNRCSYISCIAPIQFYCIISCFLFWNIPDCIGGTNLVSICMCDAVALVLLAFFAFLWLITADCVWPRKYAINHRELSVVELFPSLKLHNRLEHYEFQSGRGDFSHRFRYHCIWDTIGRISIPLGGLWLLFRCGG